MKALILAAGYATRLYPLTKDFPKPLLCVKGKPIIEYTIDKLLKVKELDEIIVVTNSKFFQIFKQWSRKLRCPKKVTIVNDQTKSKNDRRGAIGDMHFVIQKMRLKDDLLVAGGDNIFDTSLEGFLLFTKTHWPRPIIGVYDLRDRSSAKHYGVMKLNRQRQVVDFKEKPRFPFSSLIAMCLYFFPCEKLGLVKKYMEHTSGHHDAIGLYIDWLRKEEKVFGFVFKGAWYDIGHHQSLEEANQKF